jgi:hypothetical protein
MGERGKPKSGEVLSCHEKTPDPALPLRDLPKMEALVIPLKPFTEPSTEPTTEASDQNKADAHPVNLQRNKSDAPQKDKTPKRINTWGSYHLAPRPGYGVKL